MSLAQQVRSLPSEVRRALDAAGVGRADPVLLAVSGGADSMAMAAAVAVLGRRTTARTWVVGHVDHGLRPDSALDARLVTDWCAAAGVVCEQRRVLVRPCGDGWESAAREARYAALLDIARQHGCRWISTAHTATDQAETVLWRLVRGTGPLGAMGMPARRLLGDRVLVRPLLHAPREVTREACARWGIPFRDDPTNLDDRPRARLRAEVLPVLERLHPGAVRRIAAAAERLRSTFSAVEGGRSGDPEVDELRRQAHALGLVAPDAAMVETLRRLQEDPRRRADLRLREGGSVRIRWSGGGWVEEERRLPGTSPRRRASQKGSR